MGLAVGRQRAAGAGWRRAKGRAAVQLSDQVSVHIVFSFGISMYSFASGPHAPRASRHSAVIDSLASGWAQ